MNKEELCDIIEAIDVVRNTGLCNMFDIKCVVSVLRSLGNEDVADWILEHRAEYVKLVITGKLMGVHYTECIGE